MSSAREPPGCIALLLSLVLLLAPATQAAEDYSAVRRQYVDQVAFLVRQNLNLQSVRPVQHEAVVVLRFDSTGKYLESYIEERSGDAAFDLALESALRRSVPVLPPAPVPPGEPKPFLIRILFR